MKQTYTDCRVFERLSCEVPTSCQPAGGLEVGWNATIVDISKSGLRLRLRRRFEPRAGLAIQVPGRDDQEPYTVYAKVIHVRNEFDGYWTLGCKLMSGLSEEELECMVRFHRTGAGSPDDRMIIPEVRLVIGPRGGPVVHCWAKRLRVAGAWPMPAGKTLNLRGVSANGKRLGHQFKVIRCRQHRDGWVLRLRPLDPEVVAELQQAPGRFETV
jgi:hypothetical protein